MKKYLLNELIYNVGLSTEDIIFDDETYYYIINKYCGDEKGMRNTKRVFEELLLQINLLKLLNDKKARNLPKKFTLDYNIDNLTFPLQLNEKNIDILLKNYN